MVGRGSPETWGSGGSLSERTTPVLQTPLRPVDTGGFETNEKPLRRLGLFLQVEGELPRAGLAN